MINESIKKTLFKGNKLNSYEAKIPDKLKDLSTPRSQTPVPTTAAVLNIGIHFPLQIKRL